MQYDFLDDWWEKMGEIWPKKNEKVAKFGQKNAKFCHFLLFFFIQCNTIQYNTIISDDAIRLFWVIFWRNLAKKNEKSREIWPKKSEILPFFVCVFF